jgi:UDP-N-acetylglucosamine--N-acetylmuramyl-(pentapeptide) pyrophosphoryl-undecaprenol N-acetylglucosamine transferase
MLLNTRGYKQFEYVKEDLKDLFAMSDLVISRAGANAICELLALKKPNLLIPLPAAASRGDQILNAKSFEAQGFSMVADEDYLTAVTLTEKVHELYFTRQQYIDAMRNSKIKDSIETIVGLIDSQVNK